ncbi:MAG: hypothetical protein IJA67_05220, partial [Oscillospiraceae bacterium]|nr:hypothetical protein [Oscillospiraceae bacterium]
MISGTSRNLKRTVAAVLALLVVAGGFPSSTSATIRSFYADIICSAEDEESVHEIGSISVECAVPHYGEFVTYYDYRALTLVEYDDALDMNTAIYCADTALVLTSVDALTSAVNSGDLASVESGAVFETGKFYYMLLTMRANDSVFASDYTLTVNGNVVAALLDNPDEQSRFYLIAITPTSHTISECPGYAATCTRDGVEGYWYCADCGLVFSDESAETPLLDEYGNVVRKDYYSPDTIPALNSEHQWDAEGKCQVCQTQAQAKIGDTLYGSLAEAIAAAEDQDEIIVLTNVDEPLTDCSNNEYYISFTLNLNEHTVKLRQIDVVNSLTIKNGTLHTGISNGNVNNDNLLLLDHVELHSTHMQWLATQMTICNSSSVYLEQSVGLGGGGPQSFALGIDAASHVTLDDLSYIFAYNPEWIVTQLEPYLEVGCSCQVEGESVRFQREYGEVYPVVLKNWQAHEIALTNSKAFKFGTDNQLTEAKSGTRVELVPVETECQQFVEWHVSENVELRTDNGSTWFLMPDERVEIEAVLKTEHAWTVSYDWAADFSSVTAKAVCDHDAAHVIEETVTPIVEITEDATCEENGITTYTAKFENTLFTEQVKMLDVPDAINHDWNDPTYEWSDDNKTVTATRTCKNDPNHVETETVEVTSEITKTATCDEVGEIVYTAVFMNSAFIKQTK